jgi:hypothetical protein
MDPDDFSLLGTLPGTTGNVDPSSAWPIAGDTGVASGSGAGRYGFEGNFSGVGGAFSSIWNWLNAPFRSPMAITDVALLVGAVMVAILVWNLILYHLRIAAESL